MKLLDEALADDGYFPFGSNTGGSAKIPIPFKEFISALTIGLDVDIYYAEGDSRPEIIHCGKLTKQNNPRAILRQIGGNNACPFGQEILEREIDRIAPRLRPIEEDGKILGFAAISSDVHSAEKMLGLRTVGGLAVSNAVRSENDIYGYLEYSPKTASRDVEAPVASETTLKIWANEQIAYLEQQGCSPLERIVTCSRATLYKANITNFCVLPKVINNQELLLTFQQLAELAITTPVGLLLSSFNDDHIETHHNIANIENVAHIRPYINSQWLSFKFDSDDPKNEDTILAYLNRAVTSLGHIPEWSLSQPTFPVHFGQSKLATLRAIKS